MADFTITGETSSAVAAVLALRKALGMTSEQLRNAKGHFEGYQKSLEQTVAAQARAQIASAQKTRLIENERRALLGLQSVEKQQAVTAAANLNKMVATQQQANKQVNHFLLTWKSIYRLVSVQALHLAIGRLVSVVFQATRALVDLQIKISEIRTISLQAQYSFDTWRRSVQALSAEFGRTALDVAEGAYQTLSNQVAKGAEVFRFMGDALIFSRTAATTTANAVNLLTSVINAFGLKTTDSTEIAAVFMKTVELGRVRVEDLATTFGRISPSAVGLGITLQELGALLSGLTKTGLPVDEAMTGMNQVMLKLTIPSKKLTAIMREWGYESGRAAIAAMGFTGVLMRLEKEASASADKMEFLGEVFRRVRAVRAGAAIFNPAFLEKYRKELDQITNSLGDYAKQSKIAFEKENTSVKIQQMIEQFKNYLAENVSKPMLDLLVKLGGDNGFVGMFLKVRGAIEGILAPVTTLVGALSKIGLSVREWIFLIGTLKFTWMAYSRRVISDSQNQVRIQKLFGFEIKRTTHEAAALATGFKVLGLAIRSTLTVGLSLLTMFILEQISARKEAELLRQQQQDTLNDYALAQEEAKKDIDKSTAESTQQRLLRFKKFLDTQHSLFLQASAEIQKVLNRIGDYYKEMAADAATATKRIWATALDDLNATVAAYKKQVTDAKHILKSLQKELKDAPREERKRLFTLGLEQNADNPKAQMAASRQYLETLKNEAIAAAAKAKKTLSREDFDEATAQWNTYLAALSDYGKLTARIAADANANAADANAGRKEGVRLEEQMTKAMKERETFLKSLEPLTKQQIIDKEETARKQKEQVDKTKQLMIDLQNRIKTPSTSGETPQERMFSITSMQRQLQQQIDGIVNPKTKSELQKALETQIKIIKNQEAAAAVTKKVSDAQKELAAVKQQQQDAEKSYADRMKAADQAPDVLLKSLKSIIPNLKAALPTERRGRVQGDDYKLSDLGILATHKYLNEVVAKIPLDVYNVPEHIKNSQFYAPKAQIGAPTKLLSRDGPFKQRSYIEADPIIDEIAALRNKLAKTTDPSEQNHLAEMIRQRVNFLLDVLKEFERLSGGGSAFSGGDLGYRFTEGKWTSKPRDPDASKDLPAALGQSLQEIITKADKAISAISAKDKAKSDLDSFQSKIADKNFDLKALLQDLSGYTAASHTTAELQSKLLVTMDQVLIRLMELIKRMPLSGHAAGGLIAGGIPNKDSVMSMLMPGEFVINSKAAKNNLAMLDAINRGGQLPGFSVGGMLASSHSNSQNTSIGDINIVVNGGPTNQDTVRELGIALRREIRKGTVSLS